MSKRLGLGIGVGSYSSYYQGTEIVPLPYSIDASTFTVGSHIGYPWTYKSGTNSAVIDVDHSGANNIIKTSSIMYIDPGINDIDISCNFYLGQEIGGTYYDSYTIYLRYKDNDNYIKVEYSASNNYMLFTKRENGNNTIIRNIPLVNINYYYSAIHLEIRGDTFTVYPSNTQIPYYTFTESFNSECTTIGFISMNGIRSIELSAPYGISLPVTDTFDSSSIQVPLDDLWHRIDSETAYGNPIYKQNGKAVTYNGSTSGYALMQPIDLYSGNYVIYQNILPSPFVSSYVIQSIFEYVDENNFKYVNYTIYSNSIHINVGKRSSGVNTDYMLYETGTSEAIVNYAATHPLRLSSRNTDTLLGFSITDLTTGDNSYSDFAMDEHTGVPSNTGFGIIGASGSIEKININSTGELIDGQ